MIILAAFHSCFRYHHHLIFTIKTTSKSPFFAASFLELGFLFGPVCISLVCSFFDNLGHSLNQIVVVGLVVLGILVGRPRTHLHPIRQAWSSVFETLLFQFILVRVCLITPTYSTGTKNVFFFRNMELQSEYLVMAINEITHAPEILCFLLR